MGFRVFAFALLCVVSSARGGKLLNEMLHMLEEYEQAGMLSQDEQQMETLSLNEKQTCSTSGSLASLEYAFVGYNVIRGYPLASDPDPGYTLPIFATDFSDNYVTSDCGYEVPKGVHYANSLSCSSTFESSEVRTQQDLAEALSVDADVGGGGWGVSFSASAGYQEASQSMSQSNSVLIISTAHCYYHALKLDIYDPPPLHSSFRIAVNNLLATSSNEEAKYMSFFDNYGTHYPIDTSFGARYSNVYKMDQSAYSEASQSSISVEVQAAYAGAYSVNAGFAMTTEESEAVSNFQSNTQVTTTSLGALLEPDGNVLQWASTAHESPMPVKYKLESIENLFTSTFFKDYDIDYETVRTKIIYYKARYCDYKLANGDVDTCEDLSGIITCSPELCQNGGTCTEQGTSYTCTCRTNFGGDNCQNYIAMSTMCDASYLTNCYAIENTRHQKAEAVPSCLHNYGGHLLDIESSAENNALYLMFAALTFPAWTDGVTTNSNGGVRWQTSGQTASFTNWHPAEPNGNTGSCVATYSSGAWDDVSCSYERLSICKFPANPAERVGVCAVTFGRSCYQLIPKKMSHADAQAHCSRFFTGHLVAIETAEEHTALRQVFEAIQGTWGQDGAWTGGKTIAGGNGQVRQVRWQHSGQTSNYYNWARGEPNGGTARPCIQVYNDGQWDDHNCSDKLKSICEYDA